MRSSRITEWALNPLTSGFIRDRRQKQKDTRKRPCKDTDTGKKIKLTTFIHYIQK